MKHEKRRRDGKQAAWRRDGEKQNGSENEKALSKMAKNESIIINNDISGITAPRCRMRGAHCGICARRLAARRARGCTALAAHLCASARRA